jgi:hypothetical protein
MIKKAMVVIPKIFDFCDSVTKRVGKSNFFGGGGGGEDDNFIRNFISKISYTEVIVRIFTDITV